MELLHPQQSTRTGWTNGKFRLHRAVRREPRPRLGTQHLRFRVRRRRAYFPFGTTCYAWTHQPAALQQQTIETLRNAPFNKMRMCIFPKWYTYNQDEPPVYPFPRAQGQNDYTRFVPEFFHNLENRVAQLQSLGIEADLILFIPTTIGAPR